MVLGKYFLGEKNIEDFRNTPNSGVRLFVYQQIVNW